LVRKLITTEAERADFIRLISEVSLDRPYVAEFKQFRKGRSLAQNKLFWLWLRCIADETGNDVESLHDHFCEQYLGWRFEKVLGVHHRKVHGTSGLDTKQFDEFLEKIRMNMQEYNIHLPLPDEQGFDQFLTKYGVE